MAEFVDNKIEVQKVRHDFPSINKFYRFSTRVKKGDDNKMYALNPPYIGKCVYINKTKDDDLYFLMTMGFENEYKEIMYILFGQLNQYKYAEMPYFAEVEEKQIDPIPSLFEKSQDAVQTNFEIRGITEDSPLYELIHRNRNKKNVIEKTTEEENTQQKINTENEDDLYQLGGKSKSKRKSRSKSKRKSRSRRKRSKK